MHPVRQNIARHSEVDGDIGITPAVYNPALQQDAVVCGHILEEDAKSVTSHGLHWGDLGHVTDLSVVAVIAGHPAARGP